MPPARWTHHEEDAALQWCFPAQGRVEGQPQSRVLQKGHSSAGCASQGQISPRSLPTDRQTDRQTRSGGSTSPATPTLRLRVQRAEAAIASSAPKLSRSAFLSDIHPSRGGKCKRKNSSVDSLLSPLLTTLSRDPKPHGVFLAGNKEHS